MSLVMSWVTNREDLCNNPACRAQIWWCNLDQTRHHRTGRQRPLNQPYHPDQNPEPDFHMCMKQKRPGEFINKYHKEDQAKEEKEFLNAPNIPKPPVGVKLGVTHLYYNNKFMELLKCPFCNFRNIHEDTMAHHIRFTKDKKHQEGQGEKET